MGEATNSMDDMHVYAKWRDQDPQVATDGASFFWPEGPWMLFLLKLLDFCEQNFCEPRALDLGEYNDDEGCAMVRDTTFFQVANAHAFFMYGISVIIVPWSCRSRSR